MKRLIARLLSQSGAALSRLSASMWLPEAQRRVRAWKSDGGPSRQFEYVLDQGALVLDLGGYEGQWTSDVVARWGCRAHVFEPVPMFAEAIAKRFAQNPRVTVHDFGLGAKAETIRLSLAADGTSAVRVSGTQTVEGRIELAADWFARENVTRVDLMKINIEGGEYALLEHLLDAGLLPRIRHLQVQFHDFLPDARERMEAIRWKLAQTHVPEWQYDFVWESWKLRE